MIRLRFYLLLFILGMSIGLSFPPFNLPYLLFFSLALFIFILDYQSFAYNKFAVAYVFYYGAVCVYVVHWMAYYLHLQLRINYLESYLIALLLPLYVSIYTGIVTWIYFRLCSKWQFFNLVIFLPSLWTLSEMLRGAIFPDSWYDLGYTQVNNPVLRGFFPLIGTYGVSFLAVALSGALVYIVRSKRYLGGLFGLMVFALGGIMLSQIHYTHETKRDITVGLIQPNVQSFWFDTSPPLLVEKRIKDMVKDNKVDLFILPETVFTMPIQYLPRDYLRDLYRLAKKADILFGVMIDNKNSSAILENNGKTDLLYSKVHLVPFGEYNPLIGTFLAPLVDYLSGRVVGETPGANNQKIAVIRDFKVMINICYENLLGSRLAKRSRNVDFIINQSDLSWFGNTEMQYALLQASQARALENGRYFVQDGTSGVTVVINSSGEIIQKLEPYTTGILVAKVPAMNGITPYQIYTDYFMLVLVLAIIVFAYAISRIGKRRI